MTTLYKAMRAVSAAVAPEPGGSTTARVGVNALPVAAAGTTRWTCLAYPPDGSGPYDAWLTVGSVEFPTAGRQFTRVMATLILQFQRRNPGQSWYAMAEMMDTDGVRAVLEDQEITADDGSIVDVTVASAQFGSPDQTGGNYTTLRFPLSILFHA